MAQNAVNPNQQFASGPDPQATYQRQTREDFTVYELDFVTGGLGTIAPAATANGAIQIQADSAFKWIKASYYATIANAAFVQSTQPIPSLTIQVTDSGSGRQLFSAPMPIANVFGFGYLPFILPIPRIFLPRSSIAVSVTNFDAAVTYNLRLSFIGTKIFQLSGAGQ